MPRGPTIEPSDSGQYGVSLRWFLPDFAQGTEFGFYFVNYHSKLPLISGRTGTQAGLANSLGTLTAAIATAQGLASGLPLDAAVAIAANARRQLPPRRTAATFRLETARGYATIAGNTALGGGSVTAQATALATHEYAQTARYFTEYPEDIQLLRRVLQHAARHDRRRAAGRSVVSQDVPLQFDDVEVLFAALTPFEAAALAAQGIAMPADCTPALPTLSRCGQLGAYGPHQVVQGWDVFDLWQSQMTATKAFPPMLGASQLVAVIEAGVTHVSSMPSKTEGGPTGEGTALQRAGHLGFRATTRSPAGISARSNRWTASPTRAPGAIAWRCGSTT